MSYAPLSHHPTPAQGFNQTPAPWRPQFNQTFSTQSGLPKCEEFVPDPWPDRFRVRKGGFCWQRGGIDAMLVTGVALVLWAATAFLYYARAHTIIVPVEALQDSWVNINSVSSLLGFSGTILGVAWHSSMGILGARWLLYALGSGSTVTLGHWRAVASRGSLLYAGYWWRMNLGIFTLAVLTSWAISPVLSGALIPTLGLYSETVQGGLFRMSGATSNASGVMTSCYDPTLVPYPTCPAALAGTDVLTAMSKGLLGVSGYSTGGFKQNTVTGLAAQYSLAYAADRVPSSRLRSPSNLAYTEGCLPTVFPKAICTIEADPPGILKQNGELWYTDACYAASAQPKNVTGKEIHVNACGGTNGTWEFYYTILGQLADAMGSSISTQVHCQLSAEEADVHMRFNQVDLSVESGESCGSSRTALNISETAPLATSMVYILRSSPYDNGIDALTPPIVSQVYEGNVQHFENMLVAGMIASAQGIYLAGLPISQGGAASGDRSSAFAEEMTSILVVFQAYGWSKGWKGLAWLSGISALSVIATLLAFISHFSRRLRFDPSDFAQTIFIALGSRLDPPDNTCSGELPKEVNSQQLYYGPAKESARLQFSHRSPADGMQYSKLYGNVG